MVRRADREGRAVATASSTGRPSSRAASSSASPWRARSSRGRRWSSPTSRPATSTRARATRSSRCSATRCDTYGQTIVMVTHDPRAAAIADRILYIADGKIVLDQKGATAAEVLKTMNELDRRARRRVVIRVALKDLLGRKLRLILTSLAIVMGVAMVSGTFVLTDTINAGFSAIFSTAYSGSDAVVTGKEVVRRARQNAPSFPESTLAPDARRCPMSPAADGGIGDQAQFVGRERQGRSRTAARPASRSARTGRRSRFNPLTLVSGTWPARRRTRSRSTSTPPRPSTSRSGRHVSVRPAGRQGAAVQDRRDRQVRERRPRSAARPSRSSTCRPLRSCSTRWASSTRSTSPRSRASTAQALVAQIQKVLPPHTQVRTGQEQAQKQSTNETSDAALVPPVLPARLRLHRALRRRVRDREHALDHDRPAHARVRDAACRRRDGPAGAGASSSSRGSCIGTFASLVGLFVGLALAKGLDALFKAFGADLPQTGLVFATAHGDHLDRRSGSIVTLLASLRPAVRATRVPPIAAVREGSILPPSRFARFGPLVARRRLRGLARARSLSARSGAG